MFYLMFVVKLYFLTMYQISMDFLAGASRAWALETFWKGALSPVAIRGGRELKDITSMMCDMIDEYEPVWRQSIHIHPNIAYVVGGIPDITTRRQGNDWRGNYEEVIFDFDHTLALDYLDSEYHRCDQKLKQKGVIPVFATIATMDLERWNNHRNTKPINPWKTRATDYLLLQSEYPEMQDNLNSLIVDANDMLRRMNRRNGVETLDLARHIITPREGCKGGEIKYKIRTGGDKLHDGCHPTPKVAGEWVFHASAIRTVNRIQLSSPASVKITNDHSLNKCDFVGNPLHLSTFKYNLSDFNTNPRRYNLY